MAKISLLIADDHTIFRESLRSHLNLVDDLEVIGEAGDGIEAVRKCNQLHPDVVLMDFAMPSLNGLQATIQIRKRNPSTKVIVLTMYETGQHIEEVLRAGASGYVLKKAPSSELISAIRAVSQGEAFLCPPVAKKVLEGYLKQPKTMEENEARLTAREIELVSLIAEGKTNKQIADLLYVSVSTVQTHRLNLMRKLDLHDRSQLVRYAIRKGLILP